ncbi:MAG: hypothetical protein IJX90_07310 [Blautia sp.]|nr:hypothetical protein [Blautia sp.]
MSGRIKRPLSVLLAVLLLQLPVQAEMQKICGEDETVLLAVPGQETTLYYAYDEQGNRLGRLDIVGFGLFAKLVRRTALYPSTEEKGTLVRAGDFAPAFSCPPKEAWLSYQGRHFVTVDKQTGVITLYGESAEPLGSITPVTPLSPDIEPSVNILDLQDGFLVRITDYTTVVWGYFDKESGEGRELRDPGLLSYLDQKDKEVYSLGNHIAVVPYSYAVEERQAQGWVLSLDGTVLMDGIEAALTDRFYEEDSFWPEDSYYEDRYAAGVVVKNTGTAYEIYDASLQCLGTVGERPENYESFSDGFVKGLSYAELNDASCAGFVFDCDTEKQIPYAESGDTYRIWKDGSLLELPAEGTPVKISSAYCVTETEGGTNVYRLRDKSLIAGYNRYRYACVSLGSSGILLYDDPEEEYWWNDTATIYDNEGNATYHDTSRRVYAFVNGTWTCTRGIYCGLIDMYGNWVLKDTFERE